MEIENTIVLVPQTEDDECPKLIELKLRPQLLQNYTSSNQNENSFHNRLNTNEEFSNNLKSSVTSYHNDNDILCLICGVRFSISGIEPPLNIFKEKENIGLNNFSEMNLFTLLCNILHLELNKENVYSEHICSSCYNILDEWNEIYAKLKNIEKIVTFMFEETCKRLKDQHLKTEKEDTIHGEEEEIEEEINFRIRTKHRRTKSRKPPSITIVPEDNLPPIKLQPRPPEQPNKSVLIEEKLEVNDECAKSDETAASQDEKLPKNSEALDLESDFGYLDAKRDWRRCDSCNYETTSTTDMETHKKSHFCIICGVFLSFPSQMRTHMIKVHSFSSASVSQIKLFHCNKCRKKYSSHGSLHNHKKTVHSGSRVVCKVCGRSFKHARLLATHAVRHQEKKVHCTECDASFFLATDLHKHINRVHRKVRPYECPKCNHYFCQRSTLTHHLSQHTSHESDPLEIGSERLETDKLTLESNQNTKTANKRTIVNKSQASYEEKDSPHVSLDVDMTQQNHLLDDENDEIEINLNFGSPINSNVIPAPLTDITANPCTDIDSPSFTVADFSIFNAPVNGFSQSIVRLDSGPKETRFNYPTPVLFASQDGDLFDGSFDETNLDLM